MAYIKKIGKKNGFLVKIYLRTDRSGKKLYHSETYYPEPGKKMAVAYAEAVVYAENLERKLKGTLDGKVTFSECVEMWERDYGPSISKGTLEYYKRRLEQRAIPEFGDKYIGKIKTLQIQGLITEMLEEGLGIKTVRKTKSIINSVFVYAKHMRIISDNPCDGVILPRSPRKNTREIHYFTADEARRFFDATRSEYDIVIPAKTVKPQNGKVRHIPAQVRHITIHPQWYSYFMLSIYTGMRRAEIVSLSWNDVDLKNGEIHVRHSMERYAGGVHMKDPKNEDSYRVISIPDTCIRALKEWKKEEKKIAEELGSAWKGEIGERFDENPLYIQKDGKRMDFSTPSTKFKQIIRYYNQSCEKGQELPEIRLHDLRHTMSTLLLANSGDLLAVSHRLGHADPNTTLRVYSHWMKENSRKEAILLENLIENENNDK